MDLKNYYLHSVFCAYVTESFSEAPRGIIQKIQASQKTVH